MRILCVYLSIILFILASIDGSFGKHELKQHHLLGNSSHGGAIQMKTFENLSGNALEEAVIDEMMQRSKINSRIHLRYLKISKITKNMLKNVSSIIFSIDFQYNEITEIEDGSFNGSEKLEKIDLMSNRLTRITKHIFSGNFPELQEINLSFNAIAGIESGSFDRFSNLISIDLSYNHIKHLHSDLLKKSTDLSHVNLHHNELIKIEYNLFNSKTDLKILDLSHNNLNIIPEFELKSIKHYDLSHNNITEFNLNYESRERKKLANIQELSVANNRISKCTQMKEMRTDIIHLDVSHNEINDLDEFPLLLNLEVLKLSHNNLADLNLHNFEERFPSLKALNISANDISCHEFRSARNNLPHLAISIDDNFINVKCHSILSSPDDDDYQSEIINAIRSNNDEIVRQLKLNRLLFIITILSLFTIFVIIRASFLLCRQCLAKRQTKESLIEQIEL